MSEYEGAKAKCDYLIKPWGLSYMANVDALIQAADKEIARLNDLLVNSKVAGMLDKQRKEIELQKTNVVIANENCNEFLKQIATKDAELARLRKELEKIENPMRYLQEYAAETGTSIDEIAAKQLSNDADWLKGIAWEALHNDS